MVLPDDQVKKFIIAQGLANEKTLEPAEKLATDTKIPLAEAILKKNILTDEQLGRVTASSLNLPFVVLSKASIPEDVARIIPTRVARRKKAVAFERTKDGVKIALADPRGEKFLLQMVARKTGQNAISYYSTSADIERTLEVYKEDLQAVINSLISIPGKPVEDAIGEAPIAVIVDKLITNAYQDRASDIHIEPQDDESLIRFRIDGVLQDVLTLPKPLHDRIITRIKVLSNLRTDEHLSAQDGKMQIELPEEDLDIRVSIIPIADGEKVVMRLLSSKSREYTLADLGMQIGDLGKVTKAMNKSTGMILSTGPTGSGKTTSIYAILKILNTRDKNITTIEDPVEYRIRGANQIQVNQKTDLTFANGLRSILRQDPNVIFVGEIRDAETAGIAINAALTGHLVLSTVHTNNAAATIPRLIDMKIEPYLVASTVNLIIAQRLVRKICNYCKVESEEGEEELLKNFPKDIIATHFQTQKTGGKAVVYHGKGCKMCRGLGYSGRLGLFEILEITKGVRKLILSKADADDIERVAHTEGMVSFLSDGLGKVARGQTTIEEVLRVTKVENSE
jgi:type II secretory ATPase GspE/PulE/Tfp pilus assembly ATPase PilB-like protein